MKAGRKSSIEGLQERKKKPTPLSSRTRLPVYLEIMSTLVDGQVPGGSNEQDEEGVDGGEGTNEAGLELLEEEEVGG
jgi:hypothetical protein